MNGKQLLESMSYVDERYIEEADRMPVSRRLHWQHLAALAACMGLVVLAVQIPGRSRNLPDDGVAIIVTNPKTSVMRAVPELDETIEEITIGGAAAQKEAAAASDAVTGSVMQDMGEATTQMSGAQPLLPAGGFNSAFTAENRRSTETALNDEALAETEQMLVRVVRRTENILVCTVVQSESEAFPVGVTVKIDLTEAQQETLTFQEEALLQIFYQPDQGAELHAEQILPVEEVRAD